MREVMLFMITIPERQLDRGDGEEGEEREVRRSS